MESQSFESVNCLLIFPSLLYYYCHSSFNAKMLQTSQFKSSLTSLESRWTFGRSTCLHNRCHEAKNSRIHRHGQHGTDLNVPTHPRSTLGNTKLRIELKSELKGPCTALLKHVSRPVNKNTSGYCAPLCHALWPARWHYLLSCFYCLRWAAKTRGCLSPLPFVTSKLSSAKPSFLTC